MAKRKLTMWMREKLMIGARQEDLFEPPAEHQALDACYALAAKAVLRVVEERYPPADMEVLRRYDAAHQDRCIKLQFPEGRVTQFEFNRSDETAPWVPGSCKMYLAGEDVEAQVTVWERAAEQYKKAKEERRDAFHSLIYTSIYAEDVIAVWPGAQAHLPTGVVATQLTPEQLATINGALGEKAA